MLLSELEWKYHNDYWVRAQVRGTNYYAFRESPRWSGNVYGISIGVLLSPEAKTVSHDYPVWQALDDIEAQAVLFHLTKQVTENDNENVQDHAAC
jgi:hypothetical protein